jgi:hypothetical protein
VHCDAEGRPILTVHGYSYKFHHKHHFPSRPSEIQSVWRRDVTRHEEFGMFAEADRLDLRDEGGDFYNVLKDGTTYRTIGELGEQLAKFWEALPPKEAHGFPLWPIQTSERRDCPPKTALQRMVEVHIITEKEKVRLSNGRHL